MSDKDIEDIDDRLTELEQRFDQFDDTMAQILQELGQERRDPDPDEVIERYDRGLSVEADITRGTGTRDQEKWKVKGKGRTADKAIAELLIALADLIGDIDPDEPLAQQVREFQPEPEDGDD